MTILLIGALVGASVFTLWVNIVLFVVLILALIAIWSK